jgi:hypothetical protein
LDKVEKLLGPGIYRLGVISLSKTFSAFFAGFLNWFFLVPDLLQHRNEELNYFGWLQVGQAKAPLGA